MRKWLMGSIREELVDGGDAGGGGTAVAEAPASVATEVEAASSAAFEDLIDLEPQGMPDAPAVAEPKPVAPAPAPAPVPAVPVAAAPAPIATPILQQAAPAPTPQQMQQPQQPQQMPAVPAGPSAYQQARDASIAELSQAYGQFTEEERLALMTEPEKVLPQMLARAQVDAVEYTYRSVMAAVPQMIQAVMAHNGQEKAAHDEFFGQFKDISEHPQGKQTVFRVGQAYNQANPNATREQRIKDIGLLTRATLGLPLQPQVVAPSTPQPQPMPFLPPHTPAGIGGSAVPQPAADNLPWSDLL